MLRTAVNGEGKRQPVVSEETGLPPARRGQDERGDCQVTGWRPHCNSEIFEKYLTEISI